jgi:hypothetical protein
MDLLDNLKNEAINAQSVPSAMVMGAMSEMDFAKEVELANTRFNTMVGSLKIDMNSDITKLYKMILRWESDIDPEIIRDLKFSFRMPTAKQLSITAEKINNFNAFCELIIPVFLKGDEVNGNGDNGGEGGSNNSDTVREFKKLLISEYLSEIDVERLENLVDDARNKANRLKLEKTNKQENLLNDDMGEEGDMM